jgi:hypothetical protein
MFFSSMLAWKVSMVAPMRGMADCFAKLARFCGRVQQKVSERLTGSMAKVT